MSKWGAREAGGGCWRGERGSVHSSHHCGLSLLAAGHTFRFICQRRPWWWEEAVVVSNGWGQWKGPVLFSLVTWLGRKMQGLSLLAMLPCFCTDAVMRERRSHLLLTELYFLAAKLGRKMQRHWHFC